MDMATISPKQWLMKQVRKEASWGDYISSLFSSHEIEPDRASRTLHALATLLHSLPETHPLFQKFAQIPHTNDMLRHYWLSEMQLELAYFNYFFEGDETHAVDRLLEICDSVMDRSTH